MYEVCIRCGASWEGVMFMNIIYGFLISSLSSRVTIVPFIVIEQIVEIKSCQCFFSTTSSTATSSVKATIPTPPYPCEYVHLSPPLEEYGRRCRDEARLASF